MYRYLRSNLSGDQNSLDSIVLLIKENFEQQNLRKRQDSNMRSDNFGDRFLFVISYIMPNIVAICFRGHDFLPYLYATTKLAQTSVFTTIVAAVGESLAIIIFLN